MASKRALLIIQEYYPGNAPGHHRCAKLGKFLPKFGYTPTVLCGEVTPENSMVYDPSLVGKDTCETIRVKYPHYPVKSVPGLINYFIVSRFATSRSPLALYRRLLTRGRELLRNGEYDIIWATSPYIMSLQVASVLSRETGVPWVADLRDLMWELVEKPNILQQWQIHLETVACRSAAAHIVVTKPLTDILAGRLDTEVHTVPNGFDPADYPPLDPTTPPDEHFNIVYSGGIYGGREPGPIFDALDILLNGGNDISDLRLNFYGVDQNQIDAYTQGRPCADVVQGMGRVSLDQMQRIQQRSDILLLLSHANAAGIMPYKIFEYLAAARPILSIPGDGSVTDELLAETGAGVAEDDPQAIARMVQAWYSEWKMTGTVRYNGKSDKIVSYSREKQAGRIAEIFDGILKAGDRLQPR